MDQGAVREEKKKKRARETDMKRRSRFMELYVQRQQPIFHLPFQRYPPPRFSLSTFRPRDTVSKRVRLVNVEKPIIQTPFQRDWLFFRVSENLKRKFYPLIYGFLNWIEKKIIPKFCTVGRFHSLMNDFSLSCITAFNPRSVPVGKFDFPQI